MDNNDGLRDFDPLDSKPINKKSMVVFFLVDTSESMKGKKIKDVNEAMEEAFDILKKKNDSNAELKYAILTFSSGCKWLTKEPVLLDENMEWTDLTAGGITDLGLAYEELTSKLSRNSFLKSPSLSYAPVIYLISDGYPTDNYKKGLEKLENNRWYKYGIKVALGIGENFNRDVLEEFTHNRELVLKAKNRYQLKKLIRDIAVTSSQIGSKSMSLINGDEKELDVDDVIGCKQKQLQEAIKDILDDEGFDDSDFGEGWD